MSSPPPPSQAADSPPLDPAQELALLMGMGAAAGEASSMDRVGPSRSNITVHARRVASRASLGPYQTRQLEEFAGESQQNRSLLTFALLLTLDQKLTSINVATGPFVMSKALQDNIQSYRLAVLLSPKLSTYKGAVPMKRVLAVLTHLNVNVPPNISTDRHVFKSLRTAVTFELTQTRAKIKKGIIASRKANMSIYELAEALIENTECSITVALCARLALLRKVHAEPGHSDTKYWDHINKRLDLIKNLAEGDEAKIQLAFTNILNQDRELYGTAAQLSVIDQPPNEWQNKFDHAMQDNTIEPIAPPGAMEEDEDTGDDSTAA